MRAIVISLAPCVRAAALAIGLALGAAVLFALLLGGPAAGPAHAAAASAHRAKAPVDPRTWVDHDGRPIPKPKETNPSDYAIGFREGVIEPISHAFDIPDKLLWLASKFGAETERQAPNVNVFDEVPNSTWFTNRNHVRAVEASAIRIGPGGEELMPTPPLEIVGLKKSGINAGFTVKDAHDRRWAVKLDRPGYPRLTSGADAIVTRLYWAAGFNVPYDVPFTFTRGELTIDEKLSHPKNGEAFGDVELDTLLAYGHRGGDRQYAQASLFLEGEPVGPIDMIGKRKDDPNDRFSHRHRRELRGLAVLSSWVGSWDTKDQQSLETFIETEDSLGYVRHHLLDLGAALGAAGEGPKRPETGYENFFDLGWTMMRLLTLGFIVEPWRRAQQETGVPSVGRFESVVYQPGAFRTYHPHPAFHEATNRDSYWGAKLVASFSDAQIDAAIDAARFEDPRAKPILSKLLRERRDKVARYWFSRVAPLDFFHLDGDRLTFHDLAVDKRLAEPRRYAAELEARQGRVRGDVLTVEGTSIRLADLGPEAKEVEIALRVEGSRAAPARVRLAQREGRWTIVRVVHG
jgi:hypothetical protein